MLENKTFRAVLDDDVGAVYSVHDLDQRDHVGVGARLVVELDLALLELALARLKTDLVEGLYGVGHVGLDVHGSVYDSIGADSKDAGQLEASSENLA